MGSQNPIAWLAPRRLTAASAHEEAAPALAREQLVYCMDIVDQGCGCMDELAAGLLAAQRVLVFLVGLSPTRSEAYPGMHRMVPCWEPAAAMGLDVYVGTLTRYYTGDWKTIIQQVGERSGMTVEVIRAHAPPDAVRDPAAVRRAVLAWRRALELALAQEFTVALDWDEGDALPYFTDKPAWDCYADLVLWAAYDEQPHLRRPGASVADWKQDAAWIACNQKEFSSRYANLVRAVELWLPVDLPFTFEAPDVGGRRVRIGSSVALWKELRELNRRTWGADAETLAAWRRANSERDAPLESGARFAFALLFALARESVEHRLPMKLDY